MRTPVCTLIAMALALPFAALASASLEGEFVRNHDVGMMGYANKKACLKDHGKWRDGICVMEGTDSVTVKKDGDGFSVAVSTITTNAHMCDFEGKGALISPREITASVPTQKYVDDGNGKSHFEDSRCELKVVYSENDTASVSLVSDYESCQELCGANASLEIENAKRK